MNFKSKLVQALAPAVAASALSAENGKPVVIAHRGASGYLPEHTLEAKAAAHAMGADFIEQDIVLTKDDVPVVMHDVQLDTVSDVSAKYPDRKRSDGRYYALDFTLAEIKQLRARERINPKTGKPVYPGRFPGGAAPFLIPTLEDELWLIEGMNRSTGRVVGIYPEIKKPARHREEGHDISAIVLRVLRRHGYAAKAAPCWLQCFEFEEVKRLRRELGWEGRLLLLLDGGKKPAAGTLSDADLTPAKLAEIAEVADGIGPSLGGVVGGVSPAARTVKDLVGNAHAARLVVHPYTLRADELPKWAASMEDAMGVLFGQAGIDGAFTDFPDLVVKWLATR